jgi:catechol 2,3-dioxygenase-like lactoylglutathione lyase family enzyme
MDRPVIDGLRGVKLPVTDLERSLSWYRQVFNVVPEMEFPDEHGVVRGVVCSVPGLVDGGISLREDPEAAKGFAGFDPMGWYVTDLPALQGWAALLDHLDIPHSPVIVASEGWLLTFRDPDDIGHHLYTRATHGIDSAGRPGFGRRVDTSAR